MKEAKMKDMKGQSASIAAESSLQQHQIVGARHSMREYFAGQLMQHEWMTDIPKDLGRDWWAFGLDCMAAGICRQDAPLAAVIFLTAL